MPVNQQLTEEPQIGIEPMTAPLQVASVSRFPSVAPSEARVLKAPKNVRFRQNARRSGEQVVSRNGITLDRIRARVAFSPTGCWIWQGKISNRGYGMIQYSMDGKAYTKSVHRLVAALTHGPIPTGMLALHTCDVPNCVSPAHLYVGTYEDNARDCFERGRARGVGAVNASKTHCPLGHPYSPDNTYRQPNDAGRHCRICVRIKSRRQADKRRAARHAARAAA